jgi:hypothetical protein
MAWWKICAEGGVLAITIFNIRLPGGIGGPPLAILTICSVFGLRLLFKGLRDDILDENGIAKAPRWLYLAAGAALQIPAILYAFVVNRANQ